MRHTLNPKFEIPVEKAQASDTSTYEAASDVGSAVVNAAFMEDDDDDMNSSLSPLPSCYVNYNILSVRLMLMALREVEPSIFNEFSIVALKPNRRKKIPRECVVRLMEYSFGVCDGECIAAHLHVGDAFKNHLISLYHSRGKIAASMCLPPNWPELGIYSVERHADHFVLRSKLIPHASLKLRGQRLENVDFATVHIQMNWSERSALLTDSSGRLREQCSSLMASVESFEQVTGGQEVNSAIEKEENQVVAGGLLQLPSSGSKTEVKVQQTPAKRQKNTESRTDANVKPPVPAGLFASLLKGARPTSAVISLLDKSFLPTAGEAEPKESASASAPSVVPKKEKAAVAVKPPCKKGATKAKLVPKSN
jgi:hypothetical protein